MASSKPGIITGNQITKILIKYFKILFPDRFPFTTSTGVQESYTPDWRDIYFRSNDHYYAGSFYHFSPQWLVTINSLPDSDDLKHRIYNDVHSGVDIFYGIKHIPPAKARRYRDGKDYYTEKAEHKLNTRIWSMLGETTKEEKSRFEAWYPKTKYFFKQKTHTGDNKYVNLPTPPEVLSKYNKFITEQVEKWIKRGSMVRVPKNQLKTSFPLVIADEEGKKLRPCFDGSLYSLMETRKSPCVLDTIPMAFPLISKDTILTKVDDQAGFHQYLLNVDSIECTGHKFWGTGLVSRVAAFGIPIIPAVFQRGNNCAVTFLRSLGCPVSLYLDDRMMYDPPREKPVTGDVKKVKIGDYKTPEWRQSQEKFLAPRNAFITVLVLLAVGGFISLKKSELKGTHIIEFLGMILNSKTQTVKVPQRKWDKLMNLMENLRQKEGKTVRVKILEKIRGLAISFIHAVPNARMYIRRMTEYITKHLNKGCQKFIVDDRLLEEFFWWRELKYVSKETSWIPREICHLEVLNLFTDASLYAGGICILKSENVISGTKTLYWNVDEVGYAIHIKEALIILKALIIHKTRLGGKLIHTFTDNAAVYHASKFGCSNSTLNGIIVQIHHLVAGMDSEIKFSLIRTHLQLADAPSRPKTDFNEEICHPIWVKVLENVIGKEFQVDCFASDWNKIKPEIRWIGKNFDYDCWRVNFFTVSCVGDYDGLWIFPPKCIAATALTHVWTYFQHKTWVFILHRFLEWPQIFPLLVEDPSTYFCKIGNKEQPSCLIPCQKAATDLAEHAFYKFNSGPNETWAVIHTPGKVRLEGKYTSLIVKED